MQESVKHFNQALAKAAREEFIKIFPCGPDGEKIPKFNTEVNKLFNFNDPQKKIAFIVVAHFVHTLPYFLEVVSALGDIAVLISKQSGTVKGVKKAIKNIYKDLIFEDINKATLSQHGGTNSFFSMLLQNEKWQDYKFIILDHGGYFAPCVNELREFKNKIKGIVEHTWNGQVRYKQIVDNGFFFPSPVFSIARSPLKDLESKEVAKSIVSALSVILGGLGGLDQSIDRLEFILIIGYGNIGRNVAKVLKNWLQDKDKKVKPVIYICDSSDEALETAKIDFPPSHVTKYKNHFLSKADLIITATSTKVLTKEDFQTLREKAIIACATSSDDQFSEDALSEYEADIPQKAIDKKKKLPYVKYIHKISAKTLYLIADGDSVNFIIGSTSHPIIHLILAAIYVNAHYLIQNEEKCLLDKIYETRLEDEAIIKEKYEKIFGYIETKSESLDTANLVSSPNPFVHHIINDVFVGSSSKVDEIRNEICNVDELPREKESFKGAKEHIREQTSQGIHSTTKIEQAKVKITSTKIGCISYSKMDSHKELQKEFQPQIAMPTAAILEQHGMFCKSSIPGPSTIEELPELFFMKALTLHSELIADSNYKENKCIMKHCSVLEEELNKCTDMIPNPEQMEEIKKKIKSIEKLTQFLDSKNLQKNFSSF